MGTRSSLPNFYCKIFQNRKVGKLHNQHLSGLRGDATVARTWPVFLFAAGVSVPHCVSLSVYVCVYILCYVTFVHISIWFLSEPFGNDRHHNPFTSDFLLPPRKDILLYNDNAIITPKKISNDSRLPLNISEGLIQISGRLIAVNKPFQGINNICKSAPHRAWHTRWELVNVSVPPPPSRTATF